LFKELIEDFRHLRLVLAFELWFNPKIHPDTLLIQNKSCSAVFGFVLYFAIQNLFLMPLSVSLGLGHVRCSV
jgi:hypothetical protein